MGEYHKCSCRVCGKPTEPEDAVYEFDGNAHVVVGFVREACAPKAR